MLVLCCCHGIAIVRVHIVRVMGASSPSGCRPSDQAKGVARWLSGRASDLRSSSRWFEARPRRCCCGAPRLCAIQIHLYFTLLYKPVHLGPWIILGCYSLRPLSPLLSVLSATATCETGQMSVRPCGVNIFRTLMLRDRWADVDETWRVYSMGRETKRLGSVILAPHTLGEMNTLTGVLIVNVPKGLPSDVQLPHLDVMLVWRKGNINRIFSVLQYCCYVDVVDCLQGWRLWPGARNYASSFRGSDEVCASIGDWQRHPQVRDVCTDAAAESRNWIQL